MGELEKKAGGLPTRVAEVKGYIVLMRLIAN